MDLDVILIFYRDISLNFLKVYLGYGDNGDGLTDFSY